MEIKALSTEPKMTVKEVSEILGLDKRTIQLKVKELFPELVKDRETTYLNESQVTAVKLSCEKKFAVQTSLEKKMIVQQAMMILSEEIEQLRTENLIMKPKADFYDQVTGSKDAIDIGSVAKVLNIKGIGRNNLFDLLRDLRILQYNNQPYQTFIDRGYFRTIEQSYTKPNGSTHINIKTVVYQKGLDFIRRKVTF